MITESYKKRLKILAGIINEISFDEKMKLMDKAGARTLFSQDLMAQVIKQGREIGLSFQSNNEKYKMPVTKFRIILPVAMGYNSKGNLVIRGWHVTGQSEKEAIRTGIRSAEAEGVWRMFKANNIKGMWLTDRFFSEAPPGFNPNDKDLVSTIAVFNPITAKKYQESLLKKQQKNSSSEENNISPEEES